VVQTIRDILDEMYAFECMHVTIAKIVTFTSLKLTLGPKRVEISVQV